MSDFDYACRYFRYGGEYIDYDADLETLVRTSEYAEDAGEQSTAGFYKMVGDTWEEVDVSDLIAKVRADSDAAYKQLQQAEVEQPWRVWIFGPNNIDSYWSKHATQQEAEDAAAALPAALRAIVNTETARPRSWPIKPPFIHA